MVLGVSRHNQAVLQHAGTVLGNRGGCVARPEQAWFERAVRVANDDREVAESLRGEGAREFLDCGSGCCEKTWP